MGVGGDGELVWQGRLERVLSDVVGYLSAAECEEQVEPDPTALEM